MITYYIIPIFKINYFHKFIRNSKKGKVYFIVNFIFYKQRNVHISNLYTL